MAKHTQTDTNNQHMMLSLAVKIAAEAHLLDLDKGGEAYIAHPLRIMMRLRRTQDPELMQIAIMHDVIEDHGDVYSLERLEQLGFSERVVAALRLLTHERGVDYMDYIYRLSDNFDCVRVKMGDLEDNSDITRLKGVTDKDLARTQKYHLAYTFLKKRRVTLLES